VCIVATTCVSMRRVRRKSRPDGIVELSPEPIRTVE
jgi:hypothetical protein